MSGVPTDLLFGISIALGLSCIRFVAAISIISVLQFTVLRPMVRNVFGMICAIPVALETFLSDLPSRTDLFGLAGIAIAELSVGLPLGMAMAVPFWLFATTGNVVEQVRGSNLMGLPGGQEPDFSVLGRLLSGAALLLVMEAGGLVALLKPIYESFRVLPVGRGGWAQAFSLEVLLAHASVGLTAGIYFAMPMCLALLLVEAVFAFIGLSAPSLQVSFVSPAVKSLLALVLLGLAAPHLWEAARDLREIDIRSFITVREQGVAR